MHDKRWTKVGLPLLGILLLLWVAGCGRTAEPAAQGGTAVPAAPSAMEKVELTVSAAASLTDALKELKPVYEGAHPGVTLQFNFGASGALEQQITQGAPADLFFSAAVKNMKSLVDQQLVDPADQTIVLVNELVVVAPADAKTPPAALGDLTAGTIRHIGVGEPETVPAGSYAKEALTGAGLWQPLQPKLVQAKDVRQVLAYVETGNAEAGFVYKTDAMTSTKSKVAFAVERSAYTPIAYPAGVVKATKHTKEARELYAYLQTQEAQAIFVKYGFASPR